LPNAEFRMIAGPLLDDIFLFVACRCVCLDWQRVSTDTVEVRQAADTVVAMVNNMTSSHPGLCARLQLDDVTSAVRYVTSGDMLRFKSSSDLHGRVGDFSDEMQSNEVMQHIMPATHCGVLRYIRPP